MAPFADFLFFGVMLYILLPTIVLGLFGKANARWAFIATLLALCVIYGDELIVRPKGAKQPDRVYCVFAHQLPPPITGIQRNFQCLNGRAYAGNTPTLRSRVGEDVEINAFGMDTNFHTFHIHGHRWKDPAGSFVDNPAMGPNEVVTARFVEDNPGRWLYHCHVFSHQDTGMTGWYVVDP